MKERVILHCDANSFFASVEIANNPNLIGKPVAVAGNPAKRTGIILTKNNIAKKFGVQTGEAIWQAKLKCPNLICLAPHYDIYEEMSKKLHKIYEKYTDQVESFGIDECWLDVTSTLKFFGDAKTLADNIRNEIRETLHITISVGVSFSKLFAKLGSDMKKPDATTVIPYEKFKDIVYPLPINSIIGIGRHLEKRFNKMGVFKLGEITLLPDNILKKNFGVIGLDFKQKLLGNDFDIVKKCDSITPPKSVGNSTTTIVDVYTRIEIVHVVWTLCEKISTRLRGNQFTALGICVAVKTSKFKYYHSSKKLAFPTNSSPDLFKFSMELLDTFWNYDEFVRSVHVTTFYLKSEKETQLSMFNNLQKNDIFDSAIDSIRQKYGYYAICSANLIKNSTMDLSRVKL